MQECKFQKGNIFTRSTRDLVKNRRVSLGSIRITLNWKRW